MYQLVSGEKALEESACISVLIFPLWTVFTLVLVHISYFTLCSSQSTCGHLNAKCLARPFLQGCSLLRNEFKLLSWFIILLLYMFAL